jgi:hypothetical protein
VNAATARNGRWTAVGTFLISLAAFEWLWGSRFYSSTSHVGHDFALAGLGLLEGKFWFDVNGFLAGFLNPPWFTPSACAGSAFYADPQLGFYSPLQLLALWFDPFFAVHLSTLLFASVAFWGGYALARKVFLWDYGAAVVFATIGMANAFLPLRSAVGESGYQPLYLWTLLALALCWPSTAQCIRLRTVAWPAACAALCLSAWLQFGFGGMMVPAFLAVMLLCLAMVAFGRISLPLVAARTAVGGVLALVMNSSKLFESISLMRNFPRDFYALPGFPQLSDALLAASLALFQPSQWTAFFGMRRLVNVRFSVLPHEWALQFGWGALAVALLAGAAYLASGTRPVKTARPSRRLGLTGMIFAAMAALMCLPVLVMWDGPARTFIKEIPLLNSAAWPMRWIVIYIPLMQFVLAWPVQALCSTAWAKRQVSRLTVLAALLIWAGPATEPLDYYLTSGIQGYDPMPVIRAFEQSRQSGAIPIDRIIVSQKLGGNRNDSMLAGASQGLCYNPIYGYRLEAFPQMERLQEGPPLARDAVGQSLIFNPACLVHPEENACRPGDGFRMDDPHQVAQAALFVSRRPFEWNRPAVGNVLSWLSVMSWWLMFAVVLFKLGAWLRAWTVKNH